MVSTEPNTAGGQEAPAATEQRQFSPEMMSRLNALSEESGGFSPELSGELNGFQNEPSTEPTNTQVDTTLPTETPDPAVATEESAYTGQVDHPIFGGKKDLVTPVEPTTPNTFKSNEEVNSYIASKYEGIESMDSLMEKFDKNKEQVESLNVIKAEYDRLESSFKNIPAELLKAFKTAEDGGDWKSGILNSPNIDFGKSADEIEKNALIQTYFGDKLTAEDFEAANPESDDYDASMERLVNSYHEQAKNKFNSDRENNTLTLEQANESRVNKDKAYQGSVENSLNSIKSFMPDVQDEYLSSISKDLLDYKNNDLFLEADGTVKADAGKRYAMARDGEEIIKQLQNVIREQAQTQANLDILSRTNSTPPGETSAPIQSNEGIREGFMDYMKGL